MIRVLIMEDSNSIVQMLKLQLHYLYPQIKIKVAKTKILADIALSNGTFDIIFADYNIKDSKDTFNIAKAVTKGCGIILSSGNIQVIEKYESHPMVIIKQKPYSLDDIKKATEDALKITRNFNHNVNIHLEDKDGK